MLHLVFVSIVVLPCCSLSPVSFWLIRALNKHLVILRDFEHAFIKRGYGHVIPHFTEGVVTKVVAS